MKKNHRDNLIFLAISLSPNGNPNFLVTNIMQNIPQKKVWVPIDFHYMDKKLNGT